MTFQTIDFPIAGASYQSRSKPLSSQQTVNWYQQFNQEQKVPAVLLPFPGLTQVGSFNGELTDRGLTRIGEILYQVKGSTLYEIDTGGNHTSRGTIGGTERCIFANDGTNLIIVTGQKTYIYASDTQALTESNVTGTTGALSVDVINTQFLFTLANSTYVANLDNSTKVFVTDGQVGADIKPDLLVRDYVFEQTVYRFGKRSVEAWYNNPSVVPPLARLEGRSFTTGLASKFAVCHTDEYLYWLGDDKSIYRLRSGVKERISTDAISNALSSVTVSDATAYTFTMQGQNFFSITLPQINKTFCLNEMLGLQGWFELSSGIEGAQYQCQSLMYVYNKNLLADSSNGKVYELDFDNFTNDGETLKRTRVTRSISGELVGARGKRLMMSRFELIMETGEGLISGQGENPRIMIEASYDGGKTWSSGAWAKTGRKGQHTLQVEWFNMKSFYDMILRISTTDPVNYSVYAGAIDLRLAGK